VYRPRQKKRVESGTVKGVRRRVWFARLGLVALALLPLGCGALNLRGLGGPPPDVVTPADATKAAEDYWVAAEVANTSLDATALEPFETGPLLEADRAGFERERAEGIPPPSADRPVRGVSVFVPHQSSYPAEFVARIETAAPSLDDQGRSTMSPETVYLHLVRSTARARWRADFGAIADPERPLAFALDRQGYAATVPVGQAGYAVRPDKMAEAMSDYKSLSLHSGLTIQHLPGPFEDSRLTDLTLTRLGDYYLRHQRSGERIAIDFTAGSFGKAYRATAGGAVVLFTLRDTRTVTQSLPGRCIVHEVMDSSVLSALAPPGRYTSVAVDHLGLFIAADPAGKRGAKVDIDAMAEGEVAARTTPASSPNCR
jgi:hypothetical protein